MWIEVFKTGVHTDSKGSRKEYDQRALKDIANLYNDKVGESDSYEAPLVKGHPSSNAPAYAWLEKLAMRGKKLLAKIKDMSPELASEIKKGRYKKVSISLYADGLLRHIGVLGAIPPAVKGLKNVEFSESESSDYEQDNSYVLEGQYSEMLEENLALASKLSEQKRINQAQCEANFLADIQEYIESISDREKGSLTPKSKRQISDILLTCYNFNCSNSNADNSAQLITEIKAMISGLDYVNYQDEIFIDSANSGANGDSRLNDNEDMFLGGNIDGERLAVHKKALELSKQDKNINYEEAIALALEI